MAALRNDQVTPELRRRFAVNAFAHTAAYDAAIAGYLSEEPFPATLPLLSTRRRMRYGENPHQPAALYGDFGQFFEQLRGKGFPTSTFSILPPYRS